MKLKNQIFLKKIKHNFFVSFIGLCAGKKMIEKLELSWLQTPLSMTNELKLNINPSSPGTNKQTSKERKKERNIKYHPLVFGS